MSSQFPEYDDYRSTAPKSTMHDLERSLKSDHQYIYPTGDRDSAYQENKVNDRIATANGVQPPNTMDRRSTRGPYVTDLTGIQRLPPSVGRTDNGEYTKTVSTTDDQHYETLDDAPNGIEGQRYMNKPALVHQTNNRLVRVLVFFIVIIGLVAVAALGMSVYVILNWPADSTSATNPTGSPNLVQSCSCEPSTPSAQQTGTTLTALDVGFTASLGASQTATSDGQVIKWDTCQLDGCQYYDKTTGEYTAPISGLFMFTVQKYGLDNEGSFFIEVDGAKRAYAKDYDTINPAVVGSAVVLLELAKEQKVRVVNSNSQSIFGTFPPDNTMTSWFSGTLLHAEN